MPPISLLLLLLSCFSHVWLCATPEMAAHQAPPSLGFSKQEHWSGLPFPSPMHESEKWKWSCSVVSNSSRPHGLQPTKLLHPWDFPGKSTGLGCLHWQADSLPLVPPGKPQYWPQWDFILGNRLSRCYENWEVSEWTERQHRELNNNRKWLPPMC